MVICVYFLVCLLERYYKIQLDLITQYLYKIYHTLKRRLSDAFNNFNMSELKKSADESIHCQAD